MIGGISIFTTQIKVNDRHETTTTAVACESSSSPTTTPEKGSTTTMMMMSKRRVILCNQWAICFSDCATKIEEAYKRLYYGQTDIYESLFTTGYYHPNARYTSEPGKHCKWTDQVGLCNRMYTLITVTAVTGKQSLSLKSKPLLWWNSPVYLPWKLIISANHIVPILTKRNRQTTSSPSPTVCSNLGKVHFGVSLCIDCDMLLRLSSSLSEGRYLPVIIIQLQRVSNLPWNAFFFPSTTG